jgi:hypothetical protein
MSDIITTTSSRLFLTTNASAAPLPLPDANVTVRTAVLSDVPFMDSLQKMHTKMVGWMPTAQFEGNIKAGRVIIAEDESKQPVGYCIASDRYFKRDDVGIVYQMNVLPGKQRGFVGASLLKAQFERSAYGCKLYCCWCAQDIAANKFWEAMGFVPLAFRTGSASKSRVHIFWQKRIRQGDETTAWWFPSETSGGAIRENRIVLPIPPGTHWSDAKPLVLPGMEMGGDRAKQLPTAGVPAPKRPRVKVVKVEPISRTSIASGGLRFANPKPVEVVTEKPKREKQTKNDPRLVAAARELRDRWLEQVNANPLLSCGKYEVSRLIETQVRMRENPLLIERAA